MPRPSFTSISPRRALVALGLLGVTAVAGVQGSGATFSASSSSPENRITSAADFLPPTVSIVDPNAVRGTVTIQVNAADSGSGVASVRLQRAPTGTTTYTDICTDTTAPWSCSWATGGLPDGEYDLRATATDKVGETATEVLEGVVVDNTTPTVSVTDPGATLFGVVTVGANAADAGSGVATVTIQRSLTGLATWTDLCTDTLAPWSCRWDTTAGVDGLYDLRAIATDAAGNTRTSALVIGRRVDNTKPSVSLDDPGEFLRGTTSLVATASSAAGVQSVAVQRAPAGGTTWTTICTDTTSPYGCAWDTTTVADGLYDLRAVMVTGTGGTVISSTVASRRVDNTAVRGFDVQSIAKAGGVSGRLEAGDVLTLTWSEVMRPGTLVPGWDGTGTATIGARLRDGGQLGLSSSVDDTLQLLTTGGAVTGLGSVDLNAQAIRSGRNVTFGATVVMSNADGRTTARITLGAITAGTASSLRTMNAATMAWTPSSAALDLAGNASSASPTAELGGLDLDF